MLVLITSMSLESQFSKAGTSPTPTLRPLFRS